MKHSTVYAAVVACSALVAGACGSPLAMDPSENGGVDPVVTVFLVQVENGNQMDALYQGRVTRDEEGCLRLETPDRHTVLWPAGAKFYTRDGEFHIVDAAGREVGTIGGTFGLGGGETAELGTHLLAADDYRLAKERCPGRYWVVGGMK